MVFLDANILLEVILPDRPKFEEVAKLLRQLDQTAVSMLTVHLIMYFGSLAGIESKVLHAYIGQHEVIDLTQKDYLWARDHAPDNDFEDALQVACATGAGADGFITLDKKLAKNYANRLPITLV